MEVRHVGQNGALQDDGNLVHLQDLMLTAELTAWHAL